MKYWLAVLFWTAAPALFGAEWIKMNSANFELYTSSTEAEGRQTLEMFEKTRDFFLRVKASTVVSQLPVTLVLFDSAKEYRPYSPRANAPAFFVGDEERDYIVMSDPGEQRSRFAVHEYVHVLVRHSGLKLPVWLNEGMADVYSTMQVDNGRISLGAMPKDRIYSLTHDSWMRLPALVRITHQSPAYNEDNRIGIFYAQSWLLAHMLMLGDGYADKFPKLLERISEADSSQTALADVYGKGLAEIERDANVYFRTTIGGSSYKSELQSGNIGPAKAAPEQEVGVTLANVLALNGKVAEAAKQLEELSAKFPSSWEIEEMLAYLNWRKGDNEAALGKFKLAFEHGATGWKTYWDYARLLAASGGDRRLRLEAAQKALASKPDLDLARLMVGQEFYAMGKHAEALAELRQVKDVDPRLAARMYLMMGNAAIELQQENDARQFADKAKKVAKAPDEVAGVEALFNRLQGNRATPSDPPSSTTDDDPQRPILRRRPPPAPSKKGR